MNKQQLDHAIERVVTRSHIHSHEIPDLDLYIDQILTLFDLKLEDNKRYPKDKLLTKTMVNNYSKSKLLTPVKGKKYTKEQIIQMLMIYHFKNSLTMPEIKELLTPMYDGDMTALYDRFIAMQQSLEESLKAFIYQQIANQDLHIENKEDAFLIMASMLSLGESMTSIVEYMLDEMREDS